MKKFKILISLLLCVVMSANVFVNVSAVDIIDRFLHRVSGEYISEDGLYKYYLDYDEMIGSYAHIIKYIGEDNLPENYTVPRLIDDFQVLDIRRGAFKNLDSLVNVTVNPGYGFDGDATEIDRCAFYNCKNMKSLTTNMQVDFDDKSVGFVKNKQIKGFKIITNEAPWYDDYWERDHGVYYGNKYGFKAIYNILSSYKNEKTNLYTTGEVFYLKVDGKSLKGWKSTNPKAMKVTSKGKVTVLSKGKTTLWAKVKGKKIKRDFKVKYNPMFMKEYQKKNGKTSMTYIFGETVEIKKGKAVKIYIVGKADSINNVYKSTSTAKIIGKVKKDYFRVKGLKKGESTLSVTVNNKVLKFKVEVV